MLLLVGSLAINQLPNVCVLYDAHCRVALEIKIVTDAHTERSGTHSNVCLQSSFCDHVDIDIAIEQQEAIEKNTPTQTFYDASRLASGEEQK